MKNLKNLGKVLSSKEQKSVNGGFGSIKPFIGSGKCMSLSRCQSSANSLNTSSPHPGGSYQCQKCYNVNHMGAWELIWR